MTVKYHGGPITPRAVLDQLDGFSFCVSYAAPAQVATCHDLAGPGGVLLDNGAFSAWTKGKPTDWPAFYRWCDQWFDRSGSTWAVIPDVIDGDEHANDRLVDDWPHGDRGAPVWHLHESLERLARLCEQWPRVCFGSSGVYRVVGSGAWHRRMDAAFNALCPNGGRPACRLHMLRGMSLLGGPYPFDSVDSADIARNHCRNGRDGRRMALRWDRIDCAADWTPREQLDLFTTEGAQAA